MKFRGVTQSRVQELLPSKGDTSNSPSQLAIYITVKKNSNLHEQPAPTCTGRFNIQNDLIKQKKWPKLINLIKTEEEEFIGQIGREAHKEAVAQNRIYKLNMKKYDT